MKINILDIIKNISGSYFYSEEYFITIERPRSEGEFFFAGIKKHPNKLAFYEKEIQLITNIFREN